MKTYCLVCKKSTDNVNSKMIKTENGRLQLKSQCSICGNKKSKFVKEQEAKGLLDSLGLNTPLNRLKNALF